MINYMKNKKYVRLGTTVLFCLFLIVLFIILVSRPNNENIFPNDIESTPEQITSGTEVSTPETTTEENTEEVTTQEATTQEITSREPETPNPKDLINFDAEYPFEIVINRAENFAVAYGMDMDGHYSIPYKTFVCSTGLNPEDTPLGVFKVSDKYRWRLMVDGTYAQYAMRINGEIMLHSVPYLSASNDTLEYWEYNKLGKPASLGCIRFNAASIKWIYKNCPAGTIVRVYEDTGEKPPLKLKKIKKIKKSSENSGWDPTDPDKNNPWKKS